MKFIQICIIIATVTLCSCSKHGNGDTLRLNQQVYEFVFNEIMNDATKKILIEKHYNNKYLSDKSINELVNGYKELQSFPPSLLKEIIEHSSQGEEIDWKPILINATFIDKQHDYKSDEKDSYVFWKSFRDKHPQIGGYYSISKVAVNTRSLEAVVLFSYSCAVLCGAHDSLLFLKKEGAQWRIISGIRLWVS